MNLYLLSQIEEGGYDTYDAIVVAADNKDKARKIHPESKYRWFTSWKDAESSGTWASSPNKVKVKLIGIATNGIEEGVILTSFNAS